MMHNASRVAASMAALTVITACAQNAAPVSAPLPPAAASSARHSNTRPLASKNKIYIYASLDGTGQAVDVISTGKTAKIVDTITQGVSFPLGITIDRSGTLYVTNQGVSPATVTEYLAGQNTPSVTLTQGLVAPNGVAVDRSGNLWVANGANVVEYAPGSQSPSFTLTKGISGASGVAVDSKGTVYVSNVVGSGTSNVTVFPAGKSAPKTTFGQGTLIHPCGVTLDPRENVYVADFFNGEVYVYARKTYKLLRTVNHYPYFSEPCGVSIDRQHRLYQGGGGASGDENLLQIPKLGNGPASVLYETNFIYGVAADPTIEP